MLNAHFWTWSDSTSNSKSECKTDRRSSPNEKLGVKKVGIPLSGQLVVHQTTLSRVYVYRGWVTRLLVFSMYKRFTTHSLNSDASLCKRHQRGVATSSFVTPVHDELSFLSSSIIKKKKTGNCQPAKQSYAECMCNVAYHFENSPDSTQTQGYSSKYALSVALRGKWSIVISRARAFDLAFALAQSDGGRAAPYRTRGARACVRVYM